MDKHDYDPVLDSRYNCLSCEDSGIDIETRDYCECRKGLERCNSDKFSDMLQGAPYKEAMFTMNQATMKSEHAIAAADLALLKSKLLQVERELAEVRKDAYQQANPQANTYPKEIWLQVGGDCDPDECAPYHELERKSEITWCQDNIDRMDVKYIRADLVAASVAQANKEQA
jgi:hypothetical protein